MIVHLVDGTYELFRHFYGQRRFNKGVDRPCGAAAGVLHTVLEMLQGGATHIGVATDHVIEGTTVRAAPLEEQIVRILVSGDEARRQRFVSESPEGWEAREPYVVRRLDAARAAR